MAFGVSSVKILYNFQSKIFLQFFEFPKNHIVFVQTNFKKPKLNIMLELQNISNEIQI